MKTHVRQTSLHVFSNEVVPTLGDRQAVVYELLQGVKNLTNSEIASRLNWPINCVTPRIYELRKLKKVREDGKRECRVTGRLAYAWCVVSNTLF